jgi:hypothetical protein
MEKQSQNLQVANGSATWREAGRCQLSPETVQGVMTINEKLATGFSDGFMFYHVGGAFLCRGLGWLIPTYDLDVTFTAHAPEQQTRARQNRLRQS